MVKIDAFVRQTEIQYIIYIEVNYLNRREKDFSQSRFSSELRYTPDISRVTHNNKQKNCAQVQNNSALSPMRDSNPQPCD